METCLSFKACVSRYRYHVNNITEINTNEKCAIVGAAVCFCAFFIVFNLFLALAVCISEQRAVTDFDFDLSGLK